MKYWFFIISTCIIKHVGKYRYSWLIYLLLFIGLSFENFETTQFHSWTSITTSIDCQHEPKRTRFVDVMCSEKYSRQITTNTAVSSSTKLKSMKLWIWHNLLILMPAELNKTTVIVIKKSNRICLSLSHT